MLTVKSRNIFALALLLSVSAMPLVSPCTAAPRKAESKVAQEDPGETKAIDLVSKRKEVAKWVASFDKKAQGRPAFTAEKTKGEEYTVHVFEDLSDHTATFKYYKVNIRTGKISAEES